MSADAPAAPGRLVLFDLDGTLLVGDTDALWGEFLLAEGLLDAGFAERNRDVAARYARGAIAAQAFCDFYAATLAGRSAAAWLPLRDRFVAGSIAPRLAPGAQALIGRHRDAGDQLVLTTATSRFLAEPIAALLGIDALIATELGVDGDGAFTGHTRDVLNMGAGKVARLGVWLAARRLDAPALAGAVFYSDSVNDLPLLSAVREAVVVDPDPRLREAAVEAGWRVLSLR